LIELSNIPGGAVIANTVCTHYGKLCLGGSNDIDYAMESLKWQSIDENQYLAGRKQKK
jgi:hypothetical protein